MKKSLDQYLFDEIFKQSDLLGYKTYDFKPMKDVAYPFVEISSTENYYEATKTSLNGRLYIQVNVWGLADKRKQVSDMAHNLFGKALQIKKLGPRCVKINEQASSVRMQDDNSTNTALKRAIIELEYRIL